MEQNYEPGRSDHKLNILDLPAELIKTILDLAAVNKLNLRVACRSFFNAVEMSHFNLGMILPAEMEQLVQLFGRYKKPIGLTFTKPSNLSARDTAHISSLTQLTSLIVSEAPIDGSTLVHLTNLVHLAAGNITTATTASLACLTKLKSLNFTKDTGEWPNLTGNVVTALTVKSNTSPPEAWLDQFKHVQSFNLARTSRMSMNYCRFPADLCKNLTSLHPVNRVFIENKQDVPWHQLRVLTLQMAASAFDTATLNTIGQCTNLTSLEVIGINSQNMVDSINVKDLKQLRHFKLAIGGAAPFGTVKDLLPQLNKDTLTSLYMSIWHDHEERLAEISKMTKLQKLYVRAGYSVANHEPVDYSAIMTMTQLTDLVLQASNSKGMDNVTNLINLNTLKINVTDGNYLIDTLLLSSLNNLASLSLSHVGKVVDIRGLKKLEEFSLSDYGIAEGSILYYNVEEMQHLKEISLGKVATRVPWSELAQCTSLRSIMVDSFDTDDSVLALQNLKYLTKIGNPDPFARTCIHFDAKNLAQLKRLQHIDIVVKKPNDGSRKILEESLPMLWHFQERQCYACRKADYEANNQSKK